MRVVFFIVSLFAICSLAANPIIEHIDITEFQITEDGWELELFSDFFGNENLDQCTLLCNDGSSDFQTGIYYIGYYYLVVTQDDLVTPLIISANGDGVHLQYEIGEGAYFNFGTLNNMVLPPNENQSLRRLELSANGYETTDIVFAKDNTPSMGTFDDGDGFTGIFCGYVYDAEMNPVQNVEIEHTPDCISLTDIISDENGYFEVERYAFNYNCNIHLGALASMDSIISIEPDSTNYFEFVFEDYVQNSSDDHEIELPSSYYQLSNFPNPFNPSTEISFQISDSSDQNLEIQIFNSKGQKIKVIDSFPNWGLGTRKIVDWNGTDSFGKPVASGVYLYKLISEDKELAANKMLLLK